MSKAAELAALIANVNKGSSLANKNFVINGAMNVAQRGTSFSFAHDGTTNAYTLDKFAFIVSNTDSLDGTVTQATDVPTGKGFANSFKWTTGTAESAVASDEVMYIEHKVEAQNVAGLRYGTSDAKPVTLSFWVKSSITGTFNSGIYQSDGARIITKTYTISSANTWEYKTLTFAGDTSGTINDDNGEGLRPIWNIFSGSDYTSSDSTSWGSYSSATWAYGHAQNAHATTAGATFLLTGVQLEIGEKATEFEHEPFETTLHKCERYFCKSYNYSVAVGTASYFGMRGTDLEENNQGSGYREKYDLMFPVRMRNSPTVTVYDSAGTVNKCNYYISATSTAGKTFTVSAAKDTCFGGYSDRTTTIGGWRVHFAADAEL